MGDHESANFRRIIILVCTCGAKEELVSAESRRCLIVQYALLCPDAEVRERRPNENDATLSGFVLQKSKKILMDLRVARHSLANLLLNEIYQIPYTYVGH